MQLEKGWPQDWSTLWKLNQFLDIKALSKGQRNISVYYDYLSLELLLVEWKAQSKNKNLLEKPFAR